MSWEWQCIPLLPALKSEKGGSLQSSYASRLMDTEVTRPLPGLQSEALSQKGQTQTNRHMQCLLLRNTFLVNISNTEAFSSGVSFVPPEIISEYFQKHIGNTGSVLLVLYEVVLI